MRRGGAPPNMKIWLLQLYALIYHLLDDQLALSLGSHWVGPPTTRPLILRRLRASLRCASGPLLFSEQDTEEDNRKRVQTAAALSRNPRPGLSGSRSSLCPLWLILVHATASSRSRRYLIRSRSSAAFSNSNRFACSRISNSNRLIVSAICSAL